MVAWVGIIAFLALGPVVASLLVVLVGVTLADAWVSDTRTRTSTRSVLNRLPLVCGIAKALLLVVAYPTYLFNRNKLKTIEAANDFYWPIVVLGGIAYLSFVAIAIVAAFAHRAF
jgi:hypothetical protein